MNPCYLLILLGYLWRHALGQANETYKACQSVINCFNDAQNEMDRCLAVLIGEKPIAVNGALGQPTESPVRPKSVSIADPDDCMRDVKDKIKQKRLMDKAKLQDFQGCLSSKIESGPEDVDPRKYRYCATVTGRYVNKTTEISRRQKRQAKSVDQLSTIKPPLLKSVSSSSSSRAPHRVTNSGVTFLLVDSSSGVSSNNTSSLSQESSDAPSPLSQSTPLSIEPFSENSSIPLLANRSSVLNGQSVDSPSESSKKGTADSSENKSRETSVPVPNGSQGDRQPIGKSLAPPANTSAIGGQIQESVAIGPPGLAVEPPAPVEQNNSQSVVSQSINETSAPLAVKQGIAAIEALPVSGSGVENAIGEPSSTFSVTVSSTVQRQSSESSVQQLTSSSSKRPLQTSTQVAASDKGVEAPVAAIRAASIPRESTFSSSQTRTKPPTASTISSQSAPGGQAVVQENIEPPPSQISQENQQRNRAEVLREARRRLSEFKGCMARARIKREECKPLVRCCPDAASCYLNYELSDLHNKVHKLEKELVQGRQDCVHKKRSLNRDELADALDQIDAEELISDDSVVSQVIF